LGHRLRVYFSSIGVWFVFLVVAFAFGTLRELALTPLIGEHAAHIVGTLVVVVAFVGITVVFVQRARRCCPSSDFWSIGVLWLAMTASFEFLFFHFVGGKSWSELLADYNVAQGRIWVLVLLTTFLGPVAIDAVLRRQANHGKQDR